MSDLCYALRQLLKNPAFSAIAIITLALGIGANTAIFSVVNAVLLKPLPYRSPGEIVTLWGTNPKDEIPREEASYPDFNDWREQAQSFQAMAGYAASDAIWTEGNTEPERISTGLAAGDFFGVLGVEPALGRKFLPEENHPGKHRVVVLSQHFWQQRYGAKPGVIGQQISLNGNPHTIIGVLPADFQDPIARASRPMDLWLPLSVTPGLEQARRDDFLKVIARLKPKVTMLKALTEVNGIAARLEQQYPRTNTGWRVTLEPLHRTITGDVRPALLVLLGTVGFLLLIGCANVANLMLARASAREREFAIRAALGASRSQIVRQLLTESVLALMGGIGGLLVAYWGIDLFLALGPADIPRLRLIGVDRTVLFFTLALSIVTGLLFGIFPAFSASNPHLSLGLNAGGKGSNESGRGRRLRDVLAITEIALSLVLLVGAGLLTRSFVRLQEVRPGFVSDHILSAELSLPRSKYAENQQVMQFYRELLDHLSQQQGVEKAAAINVLPLAGGAPVAAFSREAHLLSSTDRVPDAEALIATPGYFAALHIPLRRGRLLDNRDADGAVETVVINEALARKHFANEDPIGQRITFGDPKAKDVEWQTIVGIVGDTVQKNLATAPYPQIYGSAFQFPRRDLTIVLRATGDPTALTNTFRRELAALDPGQPLYRVRTFDQVIASSVASPRFNTVLVGLLAGIAALIAAVGLYGVISYSVSQRTREIGVRMALGATTGRVLRLVIGHGMLIVGVGLLIGLLGAAMLTRLMSSLLYGVTPTDPLTFGALAFLLAAVAFLASYLPARRATTVNPVIALRYE